MSGHVYLALDGSVVFLGYRMVQTYHRFDVDHTFQLHTCDYLIVCCESRTMQDSLKYCRDTVNGFRSCMPNLSMLAMYDPFPHCQIPGSKGWERVL